MTHEPELVLDRNVLALDTAAKRLLIDTELAKDPNRSDREIGRVCGVDHKTVATRRAPTPTEQRHMLIEGCKDFDKHFPPGPSDVATAEEAVDNAIAAGKVNTSTGGKDDGYMVDVEMPNGKVSMPRATAKYVQAAVDQFTAEQLRARKARLEAADAEGEKNQERCILPRRLEVTIQHDEENGHWIIRQRNWPDDDDVILIADEDIHPFVDILTDHLGYGRIP